MFSCCVRLNYTYKLAILIYASNLEIYWLNIFVSVSKIPSGTCHLYGVGHSIIDVFSKVKFLDARYLLVDIFGHGTPEKQHSLHECNMHIISFWIFIFSLLQLFVFVLKAFFRPHNLLAMPAKDMRFYIKEFVLNGQCVVFGILKRIYY